MGWLSKAFGQKALNQMQHPARPAMGGRLLRRTRFDYRKEVSDGLDSSVFTAPVHWLQRSLPEARLAIKKRQRAGKTLDMVDHAMLALINKPNQYYGSIALWAGTILSRCFDGNAYWLKVRNRADQVVELWWVPWWMMEPIAPQDGSDFISHYRYSPGGGVAPISIEPRDVVHFRHGIDPNNLRKGLSPIGGVIREIFIDLESSNFVASLLRNMGVPGVVISPKAGALPSPDDVAATKAYVEQGYGGDNRGRTMVMGAPTDVQSFGFNPQQMNMSEGRDVAEERVCACLGVPAAVVGFGAGLQTSKVGATMSELRKLAWHNGVLPMGRELVDELERSLLPDFGDTTGLDLYWNTDEVLALQEEEDKQEDRWNKRLGAGGITVGEWRIGLGLDADETHDVYLRPINLLEVPKDGPLPTPATPALPAKGRRGAKADRQASQDAMRRGEAWVTMLDRQQKGLEGSFEKVLTPFFDRLGKAARAAAIGAIGAAGAQKAAGDDDELVAKILELMGMDAWQAELSQDYGAQYLQVADSMNDAAERAGLGTNLPDPVARAIVAAGGKRAGLVDLDAQTRKAVFDALAEGRAEGEGAQQLADRIELMVDGGPWNEGATRARIIARTETKHAQNVSTVQRGIAAGVKSFIVFDGRFGLPRSQPTHIARNGSIVNASEAMTMAASEHPNGTLSFAPNFEE